MQCLLAFHSLKRTTCRNSLKRMVKVRRSVFTKLLAGCRADHFSSSVAEPLTLGVPVPTREPTATIDPDETTRIMMPRGDTFDELVRCLKQADSWNFVAKDQAVSNANV